MTDDARVSWQPIAPIPHVNGSLAPLLKTVDSLHAAWVDALRDAPPDEVSEASRKRLRRHAVETGIIERLYELDWGTTEALVAEGLTSEVANQAGGVSENTLLVIRSQYAALEFLSSFATDGSDLTVWIIRQLHEIITRHQPTYEAPDQLGRIVQAPLKHGEWKKHPNHVRRPDGSLLEYCPPEQVDSQMDELIRLYRESEGAHPVVRSAWLHHRFIQIHPFEDGNGRVARALTLLVLLRAHYAPLVVDRRQRETYIHALDAANDGDLSDLIRFFVQLEISAIQSTLTQPLARPRQKDAASVIRAYVERLRGIREATTEKKSQAVQEIAREVSARITSYLEHQRRTLQDSLREVDSKSWATITCAQPPEERARWWRRQLIQAARSVDFYTNIADGSWWTSLQMEALGERLRFIAAVQKVGHGETGVLAITAYAELVHPESDESVTAVEPESALVLSPTDSVTLAYSDDAAERWEEIEAFLQAKLREAVESFVDRLG
jgi:hypothetical protein